MKTKKEYHSNGTLAYTETIRVISKEDANKQEFRNCRISDIGVHWVRVGLCAKYHQNGIMAWGIQYDKFGNVDEKIVYPSKREDGIIIK